MTKDKLISYLKLSGGILLTFPLVHGFFLLDTGDSGTAFLYSGILYIIAIGLGIVMFNYLEENERKNSRTCSRW